MHCYSDTQAAPRIVFDWPVHQSLLHARSPTGDLSDLQRRAATDMCMSTQTLLGCLSGLHRTLLLKFLRRCPLVCRFEDANLIGTFPHVVQEQAHAVSEAAAHDLYFHSF